MQIVRGWQKTFGVSRPRSTGKQNPCFSSRVKFGRGRLFVPYETLPFTFHIHQTPRTKIAQCSRPLKHRPRNRPCSEMLATSVGELALPDTSPPSSSSSPYSFKKFRHKTGKRLIRWITNQYASICNNIIVKCRARDVLRSYLQSIALPC